jgi:hypothetical protein
VRGMHMGAPSSGTRDEAVQCCYVSSQQLRRDSRARPLPNATKAFAIKSKQSVDIILCVVSLPTVSAALDA